MGVFENNFFEKGTKDLSKAIAKAKAFSLAGGGETLTAINKYINSDFLNFSSSFLISSFHSNSVTLVPGTDDDHDGWGEVSDEQADQIKGEIKEALRKAVE